jgi:hypothetical protein
MVRLAIQPFAEPESPASLATRDAHDRYKFSINRYLEQLPIHG